jgi:hypothetical protein
MPDLVPVEHDPFDAGPAGGLQLKPVEHDPFAEKPQIGTLRAGAEGFLDTAGAGFRDEVYGLSRASGLPEFLGGLRAPVGAARIGIEHLRGEPGEATATYESERDRIRAIQKAAEEQHPGAYLGGQIGGGVVGGLVMPGGAVAEGAGTLARAGAAARTGAAYGGLYGLGSGEGLADTLGQGAIGTAVGGVGGAIASPIVDAASFGARKALNASGSVYQAIRAGLNPKFIDDEAARRILTAVQSDVETHGAPWTPETIQAARDAGIDRSLVDAGRERTMALARSAANQSPEAREALTGMAGERFAGQAPRAAKFIRDLTGGADATGDVEALQAAARKANAGNYRAAYSDGSNGIWSPELERLGGSRAVQQAALEAVKSGKDRAIAEGHGAFNPGLKVTEDGRIEFPKGPRGVPAYPDLQFWDYTHRNLRDAADAAFRAGRNSEGNTLKTLSTQLRDELDSIVPSFKTARSGAAAAFGAQDAVEAGQKFVTAKGQNADYLRALAKMKAPERELFARGFASEFADRVLELKDSQDILKQAFVSSPAARDRINMALGPERAKQLEVYLRAETLANRLRETLGNSTTARQLHELGMAGAGAGAGLLAGEGIGLLRGEGEGHMLGTALLIGAGFAAHKSQVIQKSVARRVGEMLASDDPEVLRRGVNVVVRNQNLMEALRAAGDRFAPAVSRAATPQVQGALAEPSRALYPAAAQGNGPNADQSGAQR